MTDHEQFDRTDRLAGIVAGALWLWVIVIQAGSLLWRVLGR